MSTFTIKRLGENDFWCEQEDGTPFPASFLNRASAELVCRFLNRMDAQAVTACLEPIKVSLSPGRVKAKHQPTQRVSVTLDGYLVNPDKELVVKVKDEPQPQKGHKPADKVKLVL